MIITGTTPFIRNFSRTLYHHMSLRYNILYEAVKNITFF